MYSYGWVLIPEAGDGNQVKSVAGVEHGGIAFYKDSTTHYNCEQGPPPCAWYSTERNRDAEMDAMARKFPNRLFGAVQVQAAIKYPTAKEPARFVINAKGILPA